MKVGRVEGTPEEIKNLFVNHGLQLSDYIEKPDEPLGRTWVYIPAGIGGVALVLLLVFSKVSVTIALLLFLLGAASLVWLCASVQIKFKNILATVVTAIGGLLLILVASRLIAPTETIDVLRKFKEKESETK